MEAMRLAAQGLPVVCVSPTVIFGTGDVNLASTSYVHTGSVAVSYTITGAYGAFVPALRTGSLDTTPYTNIRFWINGEASGGQQLGLTVRFASTNTNGKLIKINPLARWSPRSVHQPPSVSGRTFQLSVNTSGSMRRKRWKSWAWWGR